VELVFGPSVNDPLAPLQEEISDGRLGSYAVNRQLDVTPSMSNTTLPLRSYLRGCPRIRTDKANFGPPPIGLIFSMKFNHYIQCTNITFARINSIFSIFCETVSKVTSKQANLTRETLKFS